MLMPAEWHNLAHVVITWLGPTGLHGQHFPNPHWFWVHKLGPGIGTSGGHG